MAPRERSQPGPGSGKLHRMCVYAFLHDQPATPTPKNPKNQKKREMGRGTADDKGLKTLVNPLQPIGPHLDPGSNKPKGKSIGN